MLLLSGPPGSGKTRFCVNRLREALRQRDRSVRLLLPTTTMAEHLRNELVREGFVFSPGVISTFSKFLRPYTGSAIVPSSPTLELLVEGVLQRISVPSFSGVVDLPGFRRTLVHAIEELLSAGGAPEDLDEGDFRIVFDEVSREVRRRGWHFRSELLKQAAERIRTDGLGDVSAICLAGFFSFTPLELDIIRRLSEHADLTVALSDWEGAGPSLSALREFAREEQGFEQEENTAARVVVTAPTLDQECSEIARRILEEVARGRKFRDIGILLRSEDPYVPALRSAFERFAIPGRFYFGDPLSANVTVRYLLALVDGLLSGWDHAKTVAALRMPGSAVDRCTDVDQWEYRVLGNMPDSGLDRLNMPVPIDALGSMTGWTTDNATAAVWAKRFAGLRSLVMPPVVHKPFSHEISLLWRDQAIALEGWDRCIEETREAVSGSPSLCCEQFLRALRTVLAGHTLRSIDHRRNVVHVIDAFEARQWKLPVVLVPGMLEKQFPRYHAESPILSDVTRRQLQARGVPLRTSYEKQSDELFLFQLALTRGTEKIFLSYPELNAKGDANLPSFFLERAKPFTTVAAAETRRRPLRPRAPEPLPSIYDEELRLLIAAKHSSVSPSAVERFLQCPFQFFAAHTLKLQEPPKQPFDRLTPLEQGQVVHAALESCYRDRIPIEQAFDSAFHDTCRENRIPDSYRTEAVRLDLLHNLQLFVEDVRLHRGAESHFELKFELFLQGILIRGKIDRVEVDQDGNAAVFDYKYRSKQRLGGTKREWKDGALVQAGLYLLGIEQHGYKPVGVSYCGFKRDISFSGWLLPGHYGQLGQECTPEELIAVVQEAKERTLTAVQQIRDGRMEPLALDEDKCRYCAYSSACRKETFGMHRTLTAGAAL